MAYNFTTVGSGDLKRGNSDMTHHNTGSNAANFCTCDLMTSYKKPPILQTVAAKLYLPNFFSIPVLQLEPEDEDVTSHFPIVLVGFSKGCVVLNQIIHELPEIFISDEDELKEFIERIDIAYWLDSGNSGHSDAWVTDDHSLFHLARSIPKIRVHVTPYQVKDPTRSWIGDEERRFVDQLKGLSVDVKEVLHFRGRKPSLADHFHLLEEFKKEVHV